jgi:predicted transposase YdaD
LLLNGRFDVASWLLGSAVEDVEPLSVELSGEALRSDTVFRVQLSDGRQAIVHIELQGRRTPRPMPWRMLSYMQRLAEQHGLPMVNVVLYHEEYAGSRDDGQHQVLHAEGRPVLVWSYQTIHLWRMMAEEILSIGRQSLLPLAALTQIANPQREVPQIMAALRAVPERQEAAHLLSQFLGLIKDPEVPAMTNQMLTEEELEELKEFPFLWERYQRGREEGIQEGQARQARAYLLETLVTRFNPPAADYLAVEGQLTAISDLEQLRTLFRQALGASDFATFVQALGAAPTGVEGEADQG